MTDSAQKIVIFYDLHISTKGLNAADIQKHSVQMIPTSVYLEFKKPYALKYPIVPTLYLPILPFLTCCAILPTSSRGNGSHLRR